MVVYYHALAELREAVLSARLLCKCRLTIAGAGVPSEASLLTCVPRAGIPKAGAWWEGPCGLF